MSDRVDHPAHYNSSPSGIECIAVTRHMNFNLGNATKYIWRFSAGDRPIADLEKAVWYLRDEIARLRGQAEVERRMADAVPARPHEPLAVAAWPASAQKRGAGE